MGYRRLECRGCGELVWMVKRLGCGEWKGLGCGGCKMLGCRRCVGLGMEGVKGAEG